MSTTLDAPAGAEPQHAPRTRAVRPLWRAARALASLQLTVVLFSLSMVLVFFGTLAQIDQGIWTVVDQYFRSWYVWIPFQLIAEFGKRFFEFPKLGITWSSHWGGSFPFPGGWLLGGVMLANLLAAHMTRFKLSWRRTGIITIHLGVILLMAGELVTGLYAVESRMVLQVGESAAFIDHSRQVELAFTDPASGRTATIPQSLLIPGTTVTHPDLPVDVEVTEFFKNTTLRPVAGGDDSAVLVSNSGGRYHVVPAVEESGVKGEQREDMPGVTVRLLEEGHRQGAWRANVLALGVPERAGTPAILEHPIHDNGGWPFEPHLPAERTHSQTVHHRTSRLRALQVRRHRDSEGLREHRQAHRSRDRRGAARSHLDEPPAPSSRRDVLSVGNDRRRAKGQRHGPPGCSQPRMAVALPLVCRGHSGHDPPFRHEPGQIHEPEGSVNTLTKYFPWLVVGAFVLYAAGKMYPKREMYKDFDLSAFGAIPVLDGGRIKPLDSVARTKMLFISGRSDFEDTQGNTQPAILWLLETLAWGDPNAGPAAEYRVFRVDNEQVLAELGLEERPGSYRYSWKEIVKSGDKFGRASTRGAEDRRKAARPVPQQDSRAWPDGWNATRGWRRASRSTVVPSEPGSQSLALALGDRRTGGATLRARGSFPGDRRG